MSVTKIRRGMQGKCSESSLISYPPDSAFHQYSSSLCLYFPPQRCVEQAAAQSMASVSSQMSVDAWRAGLGPSARSLSPAAAASAPGAHRLPPPDASYLGLGPVMGTRVPMGAAVVSVSTLLPHPGPYFTRGVPCLGLHDTAALGRLAIREGFLEVSSLHLGPCSRMR